MIPEESGGPSLPFRQELLGSQETAGLHGKQLFPEQEVDFILFKGQKDGKSNGNPALLSSVQSCQECRLGTPESAGIPGITESDGKQLIPSLSCQVPFRLFAG